MKVAPLALGVCLPAAFALAADNPPSTPVARAAASITVDGDLSDPGWQGAAVIDRFYETSPGDNTEPKVKTTAWVAYDDKYFYIAVRCDDPDPAKIRAPYVERDGVIGTDDNVAIFLDTRNDRRSAVELRVNPRGIQADGIFNDANFNEDFSPDFFYDSAATITEQGWQAELRVPFSTLRYPSTDPQTWGIMVWRNYPRDFRYAFYSSPQPRGSNCYICHLAPLTGLSGLPSASSLLLVPYATAQDVARAPSPGLPLDERETDADVGLDLKWTPTADTALDLTLNPDFSQVEADVAQIAVNERFALFFPEKRPFFLEGVDLFATPIQAVYTRTITAPRGGIRATGKFGSSSYTVLAAQDRGGGSVIVPGPNFSLFADQDFRSWVGIGRLRRDLGRSFVGLLVTAREIDGGAHNRVLGPDFQWSLGQSDRVTGQFLWSDTRTPFRPSLAEEWDGRKLTAGALSLEWRHNTRSVSWRAEYLDFGDGFRADQGFVPQVGHREGEANAGYTFYPEGFLRQVSPFLQAEYAEDRRGELVNQRVFPGLFLLGRQNLTAEFDLNFDRVRAGDRVLPVTNLAYFVQFDPSRRLPRLGVRGFVGEDVDFANARVGWGASVRLNATARPNPHLNLEADSQLRWLNVDAAGGGRDRLFTAQVQRLKATYNFSARMFVRLVGQYVTTERDPGLYLAPVAEREGAFSGSVLFSYRLNWQTALFAGYGDERILTVDDELERTDRQLFLKISYAFQR